jgi:hypothetical protein
MRLLTALAALFLWLAAAPVLAGSAPRDLTSCGTIGVPGTDGGACVTSLIAANGPGRYDCGEGYNYMILTPIIVSAKGVTVEGGCTLQLGAADQFVVKVTTGADAFHLIGVRITNPIGYGQTNPAVSNTSGAVLIDGQVSGCSIERARIEGLIFGVLRRGYDASHMSGGCRIANNLISVLPWNFGAYAGWTNDCIVTANYTSGDVIDGNVCVIYTGAGVFSNYTGTAYTYARSGITVDVNAFDAVVSGNTVGQGFSTDLYADTPAGTLFVGNNLYPGYNSTLNLASGTARNNIVRGSTNTCAAVTCGTVIMTGGGTLEGGSVTGGSALIDLVTVQNTYTGPLTIRNVTFRGTFANGVGGGRGANGIVPQDFIATGNSWGGTGGVLYNLAMASPTASASFSGDTQVGLTFTGALVGFPLLNAQISGENWRGASGSTITLLGGSTGVTITGSDLTNPGAANAAVLVSNGATVGKLIVNGNILSGPTKAVLINAASAAIGTSQIITGNINNTSGTF